MKTKEPAFMQELHKIREQLSKEWKNKSPQQISSHLHKVAKEFKAKRAFSAH